MYGIDVVDGMLFLVAVHVDSMTWTDALVPCYIAVIQTLQATVVTTPQLLSFSTLLTHLYMLFTALYKHSANYYTCTHLPLLLNKQLPAYLRGSRNECCHGNPGRECLPTISALQRLSAGHSGSANFLIICFHSCYFSIKMCSHHTILFQRLWMQLISDVICRWWELLWDGIFNVNVLIFYVFASFEFVFLHVCLSYSSLSPIDIINVFELTTRFTVAVSTWFFAMDCSLLLICSVVVSV